MICEWDPYNAVIISEYGGIVEFEHIEENITYREEMDEQTGYKEWVIIETKDKKKIPMIHILDRAGEVLKVYNLPVGAHLTVEEGLQQWSLVKTWPKYQGLWVKFRILLVVCLGLRSFSKHVNLLTLLWFLKLMVSLVLVKSNGG